MAGAARVRTTSAAAAATIDWKVRIYYLSLSLSLFNGPRRSLLANGFAVLLPETRACQEVHDVEVVLVARVLEHLLLGIDLGPRNERRPRFGPCRRIGDRELVVDRVGRDAGEALGDRECRGVGVLEQHAFIGAEVRRLDDERRSVPVSARVAEPLPQPLVEMRPAIDGNDAGAVDHLRR